VLERHIFVKLYRFLPCRSTTGAILSAVHDWHINLDDGAEVQAVFIDLQKAFDSVAHARLISQLSNLKYHLTWLLGSPVICAQEAASCTAKTKE